DIETGIVEDLGHARIGEQLDQVRRLGRILGDLHHIGAAVAGRKLHHAEPVAMRVEAHGLGVDRHLAVVIGKIGQVAAMHSDGHGKSPDFVSRPSLAQSDGQGKACAPAPRQLRLPCKGFRYKASFIWLLLSPAGPARSGAESVEECVSTRALPRAPSPLAKRFNVARSSYLFTSESVSEGHPDKVCDRISDE